MIMAFLPCGAVRRAFRRAPAARGTIMAAPEQFRI
jgi:hypothetical protein